MGDVNLIPAARIEKRRRKARIRLWTAICGTYVVLLGGLALSAHTFWRDTDDSAIEKLVFMEQHIEAYSATISEFQQKLAKAQTELEAGKAISSQPDWTKLLVLLGDELREEVVLNDCQLTTLNLQESLSSSPTSAYLAEQQYKLELSGFGRTQTSVSQFVLRLEQMQMFDKVELVNSRRQAFLSNKAVAFSIKCSM